MAITTAQPTSTMKAMAKTCWTNAVWRLVSGEADSAALNATGKRTEAADHLLALVKRDRQWNEDGARKQLVQFFEAWGPTDDATVEGRKKLSSILFA